VIGNSLFGQELWEISTKPWCE